MINSKRLKSILLVVYIFMLLYAPPIVKNVNTLLGLFVFSLVVLCTKYRKDVILFLKEKEVKKIGLLFGLYFAWYALSILINWLFYKEIFFTNIFMNLYSMGLVIPVTLVCVLFILIYSKRNDISFDRVIRFIIYAGAIQGIICLLSFLFPGVKSFLLNLLYYLTGDELFVDNWHTSRRFYGYSNGMVDAYGFGSGVLACLPLFYSLNSKKRFLCFIPLLLLIVILNSRTGIVIFAIGFLIWFIYLIYKKRLKEYINIIIFSITALCLVVIIVYHIKPLTITWIVKDFSSFFGDKHWGTADRLFSENFWKIPTGLRILIGAGYSIAGFGGMSDILGFSSDVGYINEIWRTGLIGMFILLFTLFYISYVIIKKKKSKYFNLIIFFLLSLLVGNIKLVIFIYNPGIVIILLYVLYELAFNNRKKRKKIINYSENQDDKISIIVPVYNAEKYLNKCLDSLINQTYKNLEIILINDGSKDNSLQICEEYAKEDARIILIDKENGGQASARNCGLDIATGKYIGFVDSDDWVDMDTYDYLYYLIKKHKADCSFIRIRKKEYDYQSEYISEKVYKNDDILVEYLKYGMKTGEYSPCTYLYSRKLLYGLRFPKGRVNEDIPFIYEALGEADILVKSNKYCYNYRMSENSTTRNKFKKRDLDLIEACDDLAYYSKDKSDKIKKLVKQKRDRSDFSLLAKIAYYGIENEKEFEDEIKIMKKNIRKNYFELLFSNMSIMRKIQLTCFVINYDFSRKVINLITKF